MTIMGWLGIALAWVGVAAIWFQTARLGGSLGDVPLSEETLAAGRRARRRALPFAVVYTIVMVLAETFLPRLGERVATEAIRILMFAGCPIVTFWGGAPLMHRGRNEAALDPAVKPNVRVASLVARDETRFVAPLWWTLPVLAIVSPFAVSIGRTVGSQTWTIVAITSAMSISFAAFWGIWSATSVTTRQDLSGVRDPEALDRACFAFRRFMARGIFATMVLAVVVFSGVGVAAILLEGSVSQGAMLGAAGGIGGSVVGVAGGLFGTLADRHRRAILELGGTPPDAWSGRRPKSSATREPPAA